MITLHDRLHGRGPTAGIFSATLALLAVASACAYSAPLGRWTPYGESGYTLDNTVHHSGQSSMRCILTHDGTAGASSTFTLNQTAATPIVVSGWSKADGAGGSADGDYSLYVDLTYMDGTPLWGQIAPFDTGTHDWERRRLTITPVKPVRSMVVYALFRHHTGTVWFDDFDAHQLDPSRLFDGQEIAPPTLTHGRQGGWFARDISAGSLPHRSWENLTDLAPDGHSDLRLQLQQNGKIVRARLTNSSNSVRCVTLYYVERYAPPSPVWWDDIRTSRVVSPMAEYGNLTAVSVGVTGAMSLYPLACVTGGRSGRVLGVPAGLGPRVDRIEYNGRLHLYYVAFDIALMPRGDRSGHDHADVAVVRYDLDTDQNGSGTLTQGSGPLAPNPGGTRPISLAATEFQWGFRSALARYYKIFPDAFRRRATADGIWMPFTDPSTVSHAEDFHIAYHEGDNSIAADRSKGILSFRYIEPMTYWMNMAAGDARDYDTALGILKARAGGPSQAGAPSLGTVNDQRESRMAQAVLSSGSIDAAGRFNVTFENTPWAKGAVWVLNPNPSIARDTNAWTSARINALAEPVAGKPDQPDGVYLDSLESWADTLDYGQRSLNASTAPLTFTTLGSRPVVPTWFSVYEDTARLSKDLRAKRKLLMANSTPQRFSVFGPLLDVMGTETNWLPGGKWRPDSDAAMNLRRTVCYHKPYLLMQNTDFTKWTKADTERYFRRCLFYGVFPSFFSADAATNPYWESAKLYNRDRPLFQKYIPLIAELSKAGWEPVTYAWANPLAPNSGGIRPNPTVWCERYGTKYITVLNSADSPAHTTVTVDLGHLRVDIRARKTVTVTDAITGQPIETVAARGFITIPVDIDASDTRVLSFEVK